MTGKEFFKKNWNELQSLKINPKRKDLEDLKTILNKTKFNVKGISHEEMICLMQLREVLYSYTRQAHASFSILLDNLKRKYSI